jgi:dUTP pyrophosphatase
MIQIQIARLPHSDGLPLPARATAGSAGFDIASAEDATLAPGDRRLVGTGFRVAIPEGYEVQIRPRSGLALKHGITLPNTPATIDSDYRGELKIALVNLGSESFEVTRGMRIAQLIVARVEEAEFRAVEALPPSGRGDGGFGSTGR